MRKVQCTNLPKFWQKQAKTFANLIGMLILCTGIAYAQVPDLLIQASGGSQSQGIAVDNSGNIYITGYFGGSVTFGTTTLVSAGGADVFIVKYDSGGNVVWARRAGGTTVDYGHAIAVSGGGDVYVMGYFMGTSNFNNPSAPGSNEITSAGSDDIFLAKYDNSGTFQWAKRAGGSSSDIGYGLAVSGSEIYITGYFSSTANFNTPSASGGIMITSVGSSDIFLAKYNDAGTLLWARRAGGASGDGGSGVAISGNDVYITGYFRQTADFSTSSITSAGALSPDIFIAKYNDAGTLLWARRAGGAGTDFGNGIAVSGNGICITGNINAGTANFNTPSASGSNEISTPGGNANAFLAQYDFNGTFLWARRAGSFPIAIGYGVAASGSGIYMTGYFRTGANFNTPFVNFNHIESAGGGTSQDIFLAKFDDSGTFQWARRAGGTAEDYGYGVAVLGSDIYMSGVFRGTANFNTPSAPGSNELSTTGGDAFVARYADFVLPIELLSFKGQYTETGNLLTWTTSSEIQNKGFDIETSKDGLRFDKIGFVAGNGTSSQVENYRFEDSSPLESAEKVVYYRLKQLDFDGNFDYSNVIAIYTNRKNLAGIFPNRGRGIFTLTGVKNIEDETFTIVNSVGQTLPIFIQNNGQFDMSPFPPGIYYLRISSNGQVMKLLKE
jgi:Beta-propeller repeat